MATYNQMEAAHKARKAETKRLKRENRELARLIRSGTHKEKTRATALSLATSLKNEPQWTMGLLRTTNAFYLMVGMLLGIAMMSAVVALIK